MTVWSFWTLYNLVLSAFDHHSMMQIWNAMLSTLDWEMLRQTSVRYIPLFGA